MNVCRSREGFIKLHHKIQESDLWYDNNGLVAFLRMIGLAHYEDDFTSIRFHGKKRKLKRGEFSATMTELAGTLNMPIGTARKVLKRLENEGRIETWSDNRQTIFRICNYSKYQDTEDKRQDKRQDNPQDKRNRGLKEDKEDKEINTYVNSNESTRVFFYKLVTELGYTETVQYTDARRRKLQARLKRYKPEQLEKVAQAIYASPFHQGDNPSGKRYGNIDFLLRSDEKVDEWLNEKNQQMTRKADW